MYDLLKPYAIRANRYLKIDIRSSGWKLSSGLFTFLLVDYTWIYFRARGVHAALAIQSQIARDFWLPYLLSNDLLAIFGDYSTLVVLLFSIAFLFYTDYLQLCGVDWKKKILSQQIVYRWIVYIMIILILLIFGVYGVANGQTQFIYFQF